MSKKITCECLIDSRTGEPLILEFPDDVSDECIENIGNSGLEAGYRMKMRLESIEKTHETSK